jgi:hypothetical protein
MEAELGLLDGIIEARASFWDQPFNGKEYIVARWAGAIFMKDFGAWKAGDEAYEVQFDPLLGLLTETNQDGKVVKGQFITLTPDCVGFHYSSKGVERGSERDLRVDSHRNDPVRDISDS